VTSCQLGDDVSIKHYIKHYELRERQLTPIGRAKLLWTCLCWAFFIWYWSLARGAGPLSVLVKTYLTFVAHPLFIIFMSLQKIWLTLLNLPLLLF